MRILLVAPPWFEVPPWRYGGTELVIAALADGLVAAGHEVTLLASGGSSTTAHLHTVYDDPPASDLGDPVTELLHVMEADELGDFDVVHDHTLLGTVRNAALGTQPLVHTLHGAWSPRLRAVLRRLSEQVALVAISQHQADQAQRVPVTAVVHHGLDLDRYPVSLDHGDELVFLGRASPDKGPETAIEVARRTGRPLVMAIKVNQPDEHAYYASVLAPLLEGHDVQVVRNATHEQKTAILSRAHALIAPLEWDEPFGLALVEAGACGTPVVAYDRGAVSEVVRDGVSGVVVAPRSGAPGLSDAVEEAGELDRASCRDHVSRWFSAARMVEGYLQVYEDLRRPRFMRARPAALAPPYVPPPHRPVVTLPADAPHLTH